MKSEGSKTPSMTVDGPLDSNASATVAVRIADDEAAVADGVVAVGAEGDDGVITGGDGDAAADEGVAVAPPPSGLMEKSVTSCEVSRPAWSRSSMPRLRMVMPAPETTNRVAERVRTFTASLLD